MRDVVPTGVRRRRRLSSAGLPAILLAELLTGMALGAVWPQLTAPPAPSPLVTTTAVTVPVAEPVPVVVLPTAPAFVPPASHAPRNPFATPGG